MSSVGRNIPWTALIQAHFLHLTSALLLLACQYSRVISLQDRRCDVDGRASKGGSRTHKGPQEAGDGDRDGHLVQRDGRLATQRLATPPHHLIHPGLCCCGRGRPAVAVAVEVALSACQRALLCTAAYLITREVPCNTITFSPVSPSLHSRERQRGVPCVQQLVSPSVLTLTICYAQSSSHLGVQGHAGPAGRT